MKKIYKNLLLAMATMICTSAGAQVSSYLFAQTQGTYTPITGGSVIATATSNAATGNLGATVWNMPNGTIPFPFVFNNVSYTGFNISCNGYITFGATAPLTTGGSPISATTAYDGAIAAWGRVTNGAFQLTANSFSYTSELRVEVIGTAPSRTVVIQYANWRFSSGTGTTSWLQDWQIRLTETTNVVEIHYGPGVMAGGSSTTLGFNCQVGLRGLTNADYNNRSSTGTFNTSTTGTINTANQVIATSNGAPTSIPPSGLKYRWYPTCSSSAPVTPSITAASTLLCEGDTIKFTATGETPYININYQWQVSTVPNGPYTNVTGPPSGTTFPNYKPIGTPGVFYYVLLTTCPTSSATAISSQLILDVRPLPIIGITTNPALNTTITPIETCQGETYTLTATGGATYSWLGGPTTDSYVVQPAGNPSYVVTATSVDGCVASKTLNILVNPIPVINLQASPAVAVCPGKPVVIGASGNAVSYLWGNPVTVGFLITVTPTVTSTYTVVGTAATGCSNIAIQQVLVHNVSPLTSISSAGFDPICKGEQVIFSVFGANTYTWSWQNTLLTGPSQTLTLNQTTTYTITATDLNGCASQTTVAQTVLGCVGIHEANGNLSGLNIYPNPNNGAFMVELDNGAIKTFEVMDMTGRVVLSNTTENEKAELNISDLANGIYYLRVQSNDATQIVKIVKQ